jgi:hypothetical protein
VQLVGKPVYHQVFAKTLTGKTITCEADFNAPILFLKMIVRDKEGIPPGRFSVTHPLD